MPFEFRHLRLFVLSDLSHQSGVENLKDTDFEIHILFLFLTVLGDHWELVARIGTVRKLSFYTFRKYKQVSFLKTFFG